MGKGILIFAAGLLLGGGGVWVVTQYRSANEKTKQETAVFKEKPLEKYSIERLATRAYGSSIELDETTATTPDFSSVKFHFDSDGKRVNGLAHIPTGEGPFPVIIQIRGYAEREEFVSGYGTWRSAQEYAKNGFISLAPDFLGYGGSDNPSIDVFEARFETYTTALNLISAVRTLPAADPSRIGLWGHSNGGHITLSILEILQRDLPATLWAPVTAPFPYSILYYTDDSPDRGKELRRELAEFEADYDVDKYTLVNYLERIQAPLLIHQGSADVSIPQRWTDTIVAQLRERGKKVEYYVYPGADHNLKGAWNRVVERDVEFFWKQFGEAGGI